MHVYLFTFKMLHDISDLELVKLYNILVPYSPTTLEFLSREGERPKTPIRGGL